MTKGCKPRFHCSSAPGSCAAFAPSCSSHFLWRSYTFITSSSQMDNVQCKFWLLTFFSCHLYKSFHFKKTKKKPSCWKVGVTAQLSGCKAGDQGQPTTDGDREGSALRRSCNVCYVGASVWQEAGTGVRQKGGALAPRNGFCVAWVSTSGWADLAAQV